jgi:predicted RNA-binding Zn-ribbon protein involved in translation (DUF1610 family)
MLTFATILFVALAIYAGVVIYGTIVKNRWGVSLSVPNCPRCGQKVSFIRVPKSGKQAIWGGYTCSSCGCEMDKYGREIAK